MNKYVSALLRVGLGIMFLIHGLDKFQTGIENVAGYFGSIGLPGFFAYIVASAEVAGGIALILGLLTRVVSGGFILIMLGAIISVKLPLGFLGNGQMPGYELDIAYLLIALHLMFAPATAFAVDRLLFRDKSGVGEVAE
ncbi:DoxX family protein [Paenibacillus massiliensis]|uniref:DoxX family protein n=1 Tax=Paenibacillus massiliensis TaxID=225917 RepID=UPI00041B1445|nr:DoxX family protein [Paenibacillus massiliensis]